MFIDKPKIDYIETTSGVLTLSGQLSSLIVTGKSPLSILSTTAVSNLNADMLDGKHASDLQATINSGNLSATSPIQQTGGTGAVIGSGVTISIQDSSTSQKGAVQLSNSYSGTVQTLATTEKALSDGLATKQNTLTNPITGLGTSGQLAQFNGTNTIIGGGTLTAASVSVSTVAFNKNLTAADDTVQKALNTLDDLTTSGAGSDTTAIHNNISGELTAIAAKATPVDADHLLIEDSADTNKKKSITRAGLFASPVIVTSILDASSSADGSIHTDGGAGIAKSLYAGQHIVSGLDTTATRFLVSTNTTETTATDIGAMKISGGAGIAKSVSVGGIYMNVQEINLDVTIPVDYNGYNVGPISIASGSTVTISSGSTWTII